MGLALDEPNTNDEKIELEGFSFIIAPEVANTIRSYGNLFIDYMEQPSKKGFELSLLGKVSC
jgi:Fe-S cluster assembly iron-binding protein IscA